MIDSILRVSNAGEHGGDQQKACCGYGSVTSGVVRIDDTGRLPRSLRVLQS